MAAKKTARDIFLDALEQAPAERAAYLNEACNDPAVRQRVEALLRANEDPGAFLSEANLGAGDAARSPPAEAGDATSAHTPNGQPPTEGYGDPTAHVGTILAGKYKLIEEIGEGGMGSVYMAQQTEPVKRAVAVKVIKAGMDSKAVLVRFEAERQALAMMDHPNIAKVLDAGTTEGGRPFFVMELVKGTPITEYCDDHKLSPRQRLELFVPVCLAIQHAHQKGIIHRDIKPSNVLVAMYDDRPVPKVIDFGVAKAAGQTLTDKTLMTGFGAVVGTPEYMSPEQANLNNLDVDTRSDVYSLGVLLYELLTGSTPMDRKSLGKAALLEILRIVREVEAPRPSAKLSSSDTLPSVAANRGTEPAKLSRMLKGELDWVLLKALEKDRTRRYDTANAISRDIQRYLADEVVEARPPSAGYRLKKFVKRHKGQVFAASLVLLVLVAGIVGTTLGLVAAREKETAAVTARNKEEVARNDAIAARNDLAQANTELLASNDKLLSGAARSLLRPLAAQVQANQPLPPLNDQEVEPLWDLAATTDERLRLRFVEVALHEPVLTRRLKDRAAFAFQAAVGLDPTRRTRVEELLSKRLQAKEISLEEQEYVALCLAHLGVRDRRLAWTTADALTKAMTRTTDPFALQYLARALSAVSTRLEPKEDAQVCRQAAATLTQAITRTTDQNALQSLASGLSAVATRLDSKEAAQTAATLIEAMTKTTEPDYTHSVRLQYLAQGLSTVATRLDSKDVAQTAATLIQAMSKATTYIALEYLAQGLSTVATRLEPKEGAVTLTQAISQTTGENALYTLAQALSKVAARLEPKEAAEVAATLTQAMSKNTDPIALHFRAQGVSAVAARLEPKEAAQVCGRAAATLTQAVSTTTNSSAFFYLAEGLSAVASRLDAKEAAQSAAKLTQSMTKTKDPFAWSSLARGLAAVSARLEPKEAAQVCRPVAAILTQAMSKTTDWRALQSLAPALSAVAARLEPKEAAQACGPAAATLTQAMSTATDPETLQRLAWGLSAVATRMEPKEAAATLSQAMTKNSDQAAFIPLTQGLSTVATRLEPKEAAQTAATLIQAMTKNTNQGDLRSLGEGLSALVARMEPKEAAATLTQAMSKTTHPFAPLALGPLAHSLSEVAARLEPKEATQVCLQATAILTQAMSKYKYASGLSELASGLSAVAARLEPKEAAQVCGPAAATLTQAMTKTTNLSALSELALGLSAVAGRLEPKEASQVCGQATTALTQAMSKTTDPDDPNTLPNLVWSLSAVVARLEPKEATQVCGQATATLTQAMSKTTDPETLRNLAQGVSAVLAREDPMKPRQRLLSVTVTVAGLGGPGHPFAALARAQPGLELVPPPLPLQTLIELLKHPFCVGEPRRLILDQLARHYHRPFADQWDFVVFAEEKKLSLDFTSPAQQR